MTCALRYFCMSTRTSVRLRWSAFIWARGSPGFAAIPRNPAAKSGCLRAHFYGLHLIRPAVLIDILMYRKVPVMLRQVIAKAACRGCLKNASVLKISVVLGDLQK